MRKIDHLLSLYGESHQDQTNKLIHWICVPLIFFSMVGLFFSIPAEGVQRFLGEGNPYANWATVVLVLVLIYYASLSIVLSFGMLLFIVLCLYVSRLIMQADIAPLWLVSTIVFVVAWMAQFYGHKIEGKRPSFLTDVQFLLIGPAWLLHFIYRRLGIPY